MTRETGGTNGRARTETWKQDGFDLASWAENREYAGSVQKQLTWYVLLLRGLPYAVGCAWQTDVSGMMFSIYLAMENQ